MNAKADRFQVVLADPPWRFKDRLPGPGRGAEKHYGCLSVAELCAFPLPPLADDCALLLWRVASMQHEALAVMSSWGFTLKSELVWLKQTPTGKRWFGMGRTVRAEHEVCLIGTRGRPVTRSKSVRSTFTAIVGRHSEKPTAFYDIVESLYAGPYCELFARHRRAGWTSLGDQIESEKSQAGENPRQPRAEARLGGEIRQTKDASSSGLWTATPKPHLETKETVR